MNKEFTLAYYSTSAMEIPSLSLGVAKFTKDGGRIKVHAKTQTQLFDEKQIALFVDQCLASDMVIIGLHGGRESCPAFDVLTHRVDEIKDKDKKLPWIHIQPTGGDEDALDAAQILSTHFGTPVWDRVHQYLNHGGMINFTSLLSYIEAFLFSIEDKAAPPRALPHEGLYHPDIKGIPDISDYMAKRIVPGRITMGIWFNQSYWLNNNLAYIDALIRSAEKLGANVIPVFHLRYKDKSRGNQGAKYAAETFFMKEGKPVIDVLLNPMMFSLTLTDPSCKDLYSRLNVPVIQAMMTMQPFESWKEEVQGMTTMEVSFSAAQPEFDGNLISVPIASREQDTTDPITGALIARYMPIPDRVDRVVSLATNWARLSKKKNSQKKIAIVFHHYPPRNDRIGCAAGLDSFASVKHLLDRMKKEDYKVEKSYQDGDELAHEILSGMTCDQRWLLPEQMHERAAALAGPSDYMDWHKGLPQTIKKKQTHDWGEMPGDLFVHDNEMFFAGTMNGNVFITVQPPRGYFEDIDKIYHDMYLSPPPSLSGPVSLYQTCVQGGCRYPRGQARLPGVAAG